MLLSKRERSVRTVLKKLARQRVAMVIQPGNVWVVENAVERDAEFDEAIGTAQLRGWVEPLFNSIPTGHLTDDRQLPEQPFTSSQPIYRLTSSGWDAIHGTYEIVKMTFAVTVAGLLVSILGVLATAWYSQLSQHETSPAVSETRPSDQSVRPTKP